MQQCMETVVEGAPGGGRRAIGKQREARQLRLLKLQSVNGVGQLGLPAAWRGADELADA